MIKGGVIPKFCADSSFLSLVRLYSHLVPKHWCLQWVSSQRQYCFQTLATPKNRVPFGARENRDLAPGYGHCILVLLCSLYSILCCFCLLEYHPNRTGPAMAIQPAVHHQVCLTKHESNNVVMYCCVMQNVAILAVWSRLSFGIRIVKFCYSVSWVAPGENGRENKISL